ncbi:uncharacterized protein L201_005066 [Kwoniella dendrophila CBS 6074]|uniref:20S-pre-rRNA D-site endonuclease NOB1 n=1 Tax=Kwoniella dendrophila CBS 6074 TaxID=1295534 RepID=A0AAX4K061_9TREE
MALSWSSIAKPAAGTPNVINIASAPSAPAAPPVETEQNVSSSKSPEASTETVTVTPIPEQPIASGSNSSNNATIQHLILDAGPLLSLTPLRHLAKSFHTTPMVLAELRSPQAREHWERLGLTGVSVTVENPSAQSMAAVTAFAKRTGDFAVLSQTDLSVAALTWQYEAQVNGIEGIRTEPGQRIKKKSVEQAEEVKEEENAGGDDAENQEVDQGEEQGEEDSQQELGEDIEQVTQSIEQVLLDSDLKNKEEAAQIPTDSPTASNTLTDSTNAEEVQREKPLEESSIPQGIDDESDGGEWITPSNLTTHRSRDLGLITPGGSSANKPPSVAAMTGDFAVQNILLGMGLGLVGEGGKRISKVKSFVLRCHACFKICKDSSKKFCPSCGNATLLRTTISIDSKTGKQNIHLKKNFQYHLRGTKYSIPDSKMGQAKGQQKGGSGLILREDQQEWSNAVKYQVIQKQKQDRRREKGALEGWNDPDWMPEIISVGSSGKGRTYGSGMPSIGHGRKNPNQARRKR